MRPTKRAAASDDPQRHRPMIAQNFQPEPKHDAMIGPVTALPARCVDVQNERHADLEAHARGTVARAPAIDG